MLALVFTLTGEDFGAGLDTVLCVAPAFMLALVFTLNGGDVGVVIGIVLCVVGAFMLALFSTLTLPFALVFVDRDCTFVGEFFL